MGRYGTYAPPAAVLAGVRELSRVQVLEDPAAGSRKVPFSRELWIEREDFREDPPKGFLRLAPGREVRLRYAYFVKCVGVVKDAAGEILEVRCTYDPATRGGDAPDGRKVKATLHWVSAAQAVSAEVRLYDRLFTRAVPGEEHGGDFKADLNPASLQVLTSCRLEPSLATAAPGSFRWKRSQGGRRPWCQWRSVRSIPGMCTVRAPASESWSM